MVGSLGIGDVTLSPMIREAIGDPKLLLIDGGEDYSDDE